MLLRFNLNRESIHAHKFDKITNFINSFWFRFGFGAKATSFWFFNREWTPMNSNEVKFTCQIHR
jgi:hypothetical protein